MIILDTDNLLAALNECKGIPEAKAASLHTAVETALEAVAKALAEVEDVTLDGVTYQPGFGGLCAAFRAGPEGEKSELLRLYDPSGKW